MKEKKQRHRHTVVQPAIQQVKVKVKSAIPYEECRRGSHLPSLGREPVGGYAKPLKSVTHGQCDARPTVTFPAAGHHRSLTGTVFSIYCLVTEARVCVCVNNLPKVVT